MRNKHNKKRNVGIVYEVLVKEYSKSCLQKDKEKALIIKNLIKEFFAKGKELNRELSIFKELMESKGLDEDQFKRILSEAKNDHGKLNRKQLHDQKSALISKINKILSPDVFNNFVPSYRNLATIDQIFNSAKIKKRIMLEQKFVQEMTQVEEESKDLEHVDELVFKVFAKKFNEKYANLLAEQKELLAKYVLSLDDNGLSFKLHLNEEIGRLKQELAKHFGSEHSEQIKEIHEILEGYRRSDISNDMIETVLTTQQIIHEIK